MDEFSHQLRRRMHRQIGWIVFTCVCVGAGSTLYSVLPHTDRWVKTLQLCLFLGMIFFLMIRAISLYQVLKSPAAIQALYEKERQRYQGIFILHTQLFIITLCTVFAGFFHAAVFYTLLCVTGFLLLYRIGFEIYCRMQMKHK